MKLFKNALIGTKFIVCFGTLMAFCLGGFVLCLRCMHSMDEATNNLAHHWLPSSLSAGQSKQHIINHRSCVLLHLATPDARELVTISERVEKCRIDLTESLAAMDDPNASTEEKAFDKKVEDAVDLYLNASESVLSLSKSNEKTKAIALATSDCVKAYDQAITLLDAEIELNKHGTTQAIANANRKYTSAYWVVIASVSASLLVCWFAYSILIRTIVVPLKVIIGQAAQIAQGDLSVRIESNTTECVGMVAANFRSIVDTLNATVGELNVLVSAAQNGDLTRRSNAKQLPGSFAVLVDSMNRTLDAVSAPIDEVVNVLGNVARRDLTVQVQGNYSGAFDTVKKSLNAAIKDLNDSLTQVAIGADQVNAASSQIADGSQSLAQGASQQASALADISSSMEQMSASTKQNADNASTGRSLAEQSEASVKRGAEAMTRMGDSIAKIKASSDATARIVKTIDDIAFQTNLLALNAAVEAARAGDAGKGFAVVAEEVRNLAQRSAEAAKTTANLIEESVRNSEGGVRINAEMSEVLHDIHEGSRKVNDIICEIAAATKQQAMGIEQVNSALTNLDKLTQETAANSEQSASAGEQLNAQASSLASTVTEFRLMTSPTGNTNPPKIRTTSKVTAPRSTPIKSTLRTMEPQSDRNETNKSTSSTVRPNKTKVLVPLDDDDFRGF